MGIALPVKGVAEFWNAQQNTHDNLTILLFDEAVVRSLSPNLIDTLMP
jgi:hypothetical protein